MNTIRWKGVGISAGASNIITHECRESLTPDEIDKLVKNIIEKTPNMGSQNIGMQSADPRNFLLLGGRVGGMVGGGGNFKAVGAEIGVLDVGCEFGYCSSVALDSCRVNSNVGGGYGSSVFDGAEKQTIDGVNVTYASGVISINTAVITMEHWNTVPGMGVALEVAGVLFPGDAGFGIVTGYNYNAGTGIYQILTSLQPASISGNYTGNIYLFKVGPVTLKDCTGFDFIHTASIANKHSKRSFEYFEQMLGGQYGTATMQATSIYGLLTSVTVNVRTPAAVPTTFTLNLRTYNNQTFVEDSPITVIIIDLAIVGKRVITTTQFAGKESTDSITVNGSTPPNGWLPANKLIGFATANVSVAPSSPSAAAQVQIILETDCGFARQEMAAQIFMGGLGTAVPIEGLPQ
jgi:hypothetical protein